MTDKQKLIKLENRIIKALPNELKTILRVQE